MKRSHVVHVTTHLNFKACAIQTRLLQVDEVIFSFLHPKANDFINQPEWSWNKPLHTDTAFPCSLLKLSCLKTLISTVNQWIKNTGNRNKYRKSVNISWLNIMFCFQILLPVQLFMFIYLDGNMDRKPVSWVTVVEQRPALNGAGFHHTIILKWPILLQLVSAWIKSLISSLLQS